MLPPTFIWSSEENAEGYALEVRKDTNGLGSIIGEFDGIWKYTNDTTYTITQDEFDNLENITYYWHVASLWIEEGDTLEAWSEWRSFVIDKPPEPEDPSPPVLISPVNGAVFDTVPPTFIWSSDSLSKGYLFRIWTDSTTEVDESLEDTTYSMPQGSFDGLAEGTYNWAAATISAEGVEFWSETWRLIIERPEPVTDLDTTYFPFGRGYEWGFWRRSWGVGITDGESWSYDDTVLYTVRVIDSFWIEDTLAFVLETINLHSWGWMSLSLWDLEDTVKICNDKIEVWWKMVDLIPDPGNPSFIRYWGDTLEIFSYYWDVHSESGIYIRRLIGIGTISQSFFYSFCMDIPPYEYENNYIRDTVLYFYNGQDTVYKAED
jgi:hypothetical protein